MLARRLLPLTLALGALGVATTGCADQAAAARVGDQTLPDKDFRDELAQTAKDESLLAIYGFDKDTARGGSGKGSYSQEFVTLLLNQQVSGLMAKEILAGEDMKVTEQDRAQTESTLTDQLQQNGVDFSQVDKEGRDRIVALYAAIDKARNQVDGDVVQREANRLGREVEINSRYGTWDAQKGVVAPDGPLGARDETSSTSG